MPPFLMLICVIFAVLMVMFGNNPVEKWEAERLKYGKDPLAREINKFNEEREKKSGFSASEGYKPPPGATLYKLPPSQAQLRPYKAPVVPGMTGGEAPSVKPAPDIPMSEWGSAAYPGYMYAPGTQQGGLPRLQGGTSIVPGGN